MTYFDSFSFIGKRPVDDTEELWSKEHVLNLMNRCGIDAALVYHSLAKEYNPNYGNQLLLEEIANEPRFFGCYVGMPHFTDEMPKPELWVPNLRENGYYAVKLFPKIHAYEASPLVLDPMLQLMENEQIPLLIDINEIDFSILAGMASRYPDLQILVQQIKWSMARQFVPLFEHYLNLHVEFSNYQSFNHPDWLVAKYGPERLLFGSEMPLKTPGAARALIDYADISADDKALIAGENLKHLLKIDSLPAVDWKPADAYIEKASQGQPMPISVIDAHSHSGHMGEFNGAAMTHMPNSTPVEMAKKFKRLGVEKICISSWLGIWSDSVRGNKLMQETVEESPDTYIPYVTIDPNFLSDEEIAAEIETYHEKLRFPGMKPYFPRSQYRLTGPKLAQWFEYGNKNHLYALIHYDFGTTVEDINILAPTYPDLTFIIAHAGCSYRATRAVIELAKKYPNVVAEITFTAVLSNAIEMLCREIGSDRVLFGADAPMRDPAPQLAWVVYADISPEAKKEILQTNIQRILDRCWT